MNPNCQYNERLKQVNNQPNFFIVGAAKAGTTSLWIYLQQHPDIYMSQRPKEPAFFCYRFDRMQDFDTYLSLFADANGAKAVGEATTSYLASPESAAWIREVYPEAKIIIVLRNPVERAYSLYNWMSREGKEWIATFEKALSAEKDRIGDEDFKANIPAWHTNYLYFYSGLYFAQVERYLENFPRDQVHIILFEDLKTNPVVATQQVYEFLGVDSSFIPEIEVHNKGQTPFSVPAQYFIKQKLNKYLCKLRIPSRLRLQRSALDINLFFGKLVEHRLNEATRRNLQEMYREDIQKTARLIGRDLGAWLK
ncbi:MAG: sulfotransferase domain-containing protein [Aphanothece sp. CMT-3BRIN-NPC111]|jgi:hypothetical protein|nr:sulfotransferase domain-containing protein [Aphanothece sp. CMT-3BRIN-NPC111]